MEISSSLLKRIQRITDEMNGIGIKVIDASIYTVNYIEEKAAEFVMVGYVPHYAAIFSVHGGASGDMTFSIDGQLRNDSRLIPASGHRFNKIPRPVNAGEFFGKLDFGINIYLPSIEEGELLGKGIGFYEKFIDIYFKSLECNFTEKVILHVAPVHSIEYKEIAGMHGPLSTAPDEYFENRIKKKLPRGFFQQ